MNLNNIWKNQRLNIVYGIVILVLILIMIGIKLADRPKELKDILTSNDYELDYEVAGGTEVSEGVTFQRNTYRYQKNGIPLMVYEYSSLKEIKDEIYKNHNNEENSNFTIKFEDKENYIYRKACDGNICYYNLGYEAELVSTIVGVKQEKETDEIFKEIIEDKKL